MGVAVADDRLEAAVINGAEGDGDTRAHDPESHAPKPAGMPSWIQMIHSHVRHFKQQAQNFFARASSCSVRPLLGMAGGTIIKRRLIML
jgi:hypothetical protein